MAVTYWDKQYLNPDSLNKISQNDKDWHYYDGLMEINATGSDAYNDAKAKKTEVESSSRTIRNDAGYTTDDSGNYIPGDSKPQNQKDYTRNVQNFYDAAAAQKRKAYQAKLEQTQANYRSQLPKIAREYENVRNDVYANSRRDAFGNSEALAAQGLGRSNANAPASGYGETSRIALNTNMHNNLNQATIAEQDAKDQISKAILDAGFTTSIEEANALAEIKLAEGSAVQNQWNADRTFNENVRQYDTTRADSNNQFDLTRADEKDAKAWDQWYKQTQMGYDRQDQGWYEWYQQKIMGDANIQTQWSNKNTEDQQKFQTALQLASYGNFSLLEQMGYDTTEMRKAYEEYHKK